MSELENILIYTFPFNVTKLDDTKMICRDPNPSFSYFDQKNMFTGCSLHLKDLKDENKFVWFE
jgi:hypothetical protein